jgi:hypothetical protein
LPGRVVEGAPIGAANRRARRRDDHGFSQITLPNSRFLWRLSQLKV